MNITLIAAVRLASGQIAPSSATSAVRKTSMITRRRATTFAVWAQGMSSKTRS